MAATLDKDPYTYQKERDTFLKELWQFHQSRGTAYPRIPTVGGKEVDLYLLYSKVNDLGGWDKVTDFEIWEDIVEFFSIPRACTNASHALKHIYLRYLFVYHKVNKGDDPDLRPYDADDAESGRKRQKMPHIGVPMRYNYRQHVVSDSMRVAAGLSTNYITPHDYGKLERALLSGMPNEVDFAINVCTLLSNEGRRTLLVDKCPNLVRLLLAHVGIFEDGPGSFQKLYENGWKSHSNRNFLRFWLDSVHSKDIRALISSSTFCKVKDGDKKVTAGESDMDIVLLEDEPKEEDEHAMSVEEILNINRELGVQDVEGQRVLQMAMIVRNLSFEEDNLTVLASDLIVFRFLQLCIHNKYNALKQLALDTLGNVAKKVTLDPMEYRTTQLFIRTITGCISSKDKFQVIRGLEMLANLGHTPDNAGLLSQHLDQWVYCDIVNMLLVHDIQLIVYTLEALYQLSELGEAPASHIAHVKAAIAVLIDLLTVEAQSYGPNSLIGIKVVEHVPPPSQQQKFTTAQQVPALQNLTGSPHRSPAPTAQVVKPPAPVAASVSHSVQHAVTPQRPSGHVVTPVRLALHQQGVSPSPAQPPPATPPKAPPTTTHSEVDAEALARNWLQTHIEVSPQSVMTRVELYADYLAACGRIGIRTVINTNSFANCVRVSFPKVDSTRVEKDDGSVELHFKGLKRKQVPLPFPSNPSKTSQQQQAVSGLEQAGGKGSLIQQQLSSPLKSRKAPPPPSLQMSQTMGVQPPTSQHSPNYPTIHQALLQKAENESSPPPNQKQFPSSPSHPVPPVSPSQQRANNTPDTNLIKSLLANKVTANLHRIQQQQQMNHPQRQPGLPGDGQQSPCTSQQPMPNQVTGSQGVAQLTAPPGGQHEQSGQLHQPQGLLVPSQTTSPQQPILPSASTPAVLPQDNTNLAQPPSPRSKLKMTLVAKSAVSGLKQGPHNTDSSLNTRTSAEELAGNVCSNQNSDSLKSKPNQLEACMERVQNTYAQKMEGGLARQVEVNQKEGWDKSKMVDNVKTELVINSSQYGVNEKTNGVGSNGTTTIKHESQSNINSISTEAQMINGNTDQPLDHTKSLLSESDKLLTQDEIDRKKQEEVLQLLERNKEQLIVMNGVVNHVGNGDCMLPGSIYTKGQLPSKDNKGLGQNLNTDLVKTKAAILENGFVPSDRNIGEESKGLNIPGAVGRSVAGSLKNSSTCTVINQTVDVSQDGPQKDSGTKAKDLHLSSNDGRGVPMDIETAETNAVDGSNINSSNLKSATPTSTSQSAEDSQGKTVGNLTIAEILKQRGVSAPESSAPGSQIATTGAVAGVPVSSLGGTYPMGIPAAGYASSLPVVTSSVSTGNPNRPSALPSNVHSNPQLAKVGGTTGNVHSPTLANLPLPGDLASQVNNIMQSSQQQNLLSSSSQMQQQLQSQQQQAQAVSQSAVTPQQQTSIMQHLQPQQQQPQQQQPQQQQPQQQPQQQQQQQLQLQQQQTNSGTQFAAHMQQLQQRLQMPPQVSWPPVSQPQQQQVTSAPQQIQASVAQTQQTTSVVTAVTAQPQVLPQTVGQQQTVPQHLQPTQLPVQPSVKSQLVQRLQQPLAPSQPQLQPQLPGQQQQHQQQQPTPLIMQQQTAASHLAPQQQQPFLLQQQGVNGQVHQVVIPASQNQIQSQTVQRPQGQQVVIQNQNPVQVVSSQGQPVQVMASQGQTVQMVTGQGHPVQVVSGQGQAVQIMGTQGQPIQVMPSQGQPMQVMSSQGQTVQVVSSQGQQVQVVSASGQPIQVVNSQGQPIQVLQGQGQQVQVVAGGQGQQLIQGQQVQVVQGGIQMRGQQVQVMPGQCVQMQVQGQPQVMQLQMQQGPQMMQGQLVIQAPTANQQQQHRPIQLVPNNQTQPKPVVSGQMLLPKPQQTQVLIVSQGTSTSVSTVTQSAIQTQSQLPSQQQQPHLPQIQMTPQVQQQTKPSQPVQPQLTQQVKQQQLCVQTQGQLSPAPQQVAAQQQSPVETTLSPGGTTQKRPATQALKVDGQPNKKGRLSGTDPQKASPAPQLKSPTLPVGDYMCEWAGCKQCFETAKLCATHVVKTHYCTSIDSGFCRWENCDKLKRQKWSLITHIQDRHLTESALRAAHAKRQQAASRPATSTSGPAAPAAVPPVYPPDAAAQAIRRFAPRQPYPEFVKQQGGSGQSAHQSNQAHQQHHPHHHHQQPPPPHQHRHARPHHPPIPPFEEAKEGPVTKHIRLTSALILRNIAKYSADGRRLLLRHEQHLSYIALSSVEASTAVAHCLWEIHRHLHNREPKDHQLSQVSITQEEH